MNEAIVMGTANQQVMRRYQVGRMLMDFSPLHISITEQTLIEKNVHSLQQLMEEFSTHLGFLRQDSNERWQTLRAQLTLLSEMRMTNFAFIDRVLRRGVPVPLPE